MELEAFVDDFCDTLDEYKHRDIFQSRTSLLLVPATILICSEIVKGKRGKKVFTTLSFPCSTASTKNIFYIHGFKPGYRYTTNDKPETRLLF